MGRYGTYVKREPDVSPARASPPRATPGPGVGAPADPDRCPRCGGGAVQTYCAQCGARVEPPTLALGPFVGETLADLLSIERSLLRTLRALVFRPGTLTEAYREGRISTFIAPLRLYLLSGFLYFGLLTVSGVDHLYFWSLVITLSSGGLPGWISQIILAGVPLVAVLLLALFAGRGRHFVEYVVLAFNLHSLLFLAGVPLTLLWNWLPLPEAAMSRGNTPALIVGGVWLFFALRRVTGAGRVRTTLGVLGVTVGYLAVMLGGILLWALWSGTAAELQAP